MGGYIERALTWVDLQLAVVHHKRQVAPCALCGAFVLEGLALSIRSNAEQHLDEDISSVLHDGASMHLA